MNSTLFSSANKSAGNSTIATSASTTSPARKPIAKKRDNFIVYSMKQLWSFCVGFWTRFRKFMWIGSTGNCFCYSGFIILVVPFVFSYMQEMQNEMIRMMESNELI
jgi:hypothetical protein